MLAMMQRKRSLLHCWWECKLVQPLWKTVSRFLKKLKIELPYDPAIALLGYLSKGDKHSDSREHLHPNVYSSITCNSQTMDKAQMSIDRWMGRDDVVNIPTATSLVHQNGWSEAIYNDMGEVERTYAKWTQSEEDIYQIPYNCIHMWILRNQTNWQRGRGGMREANKKTHYQPQRIN